MSKNDESGEIITCATCNKPVDDDLECIECESALCADAECSAACEICGEIYCNDCAVNIEYQGYERNFAGDFEFACPACP